MKFYIRTLGCKVNQSEADKLASDLKKRGFNRVDSGIGADFAFINTCTVTSAADAKSRQLISKAIKQTKGKVFILGCAVNNPESGLTKFKNVEFVTQHDKNNLAQLFGSVIEKNGYINKRSRPLVKIQDGCDHECSYCIVPFVRGSSKSISSRQVKDEIRDLLDKGYQEIVLTGVDIGAYNDGGQSLALLLKDILMMDKYFRVRLSSLEPQSVTDDFLDLYASEKRICNHVHLPLQSGSNRILALMNRPYDIRRYTDIVEKIKSARRGTALTTDVIVGFPGETDQDFKQTLSIVERASFAKIHTFPYSGRPATPACDLDDKIKTEVKKQRAKELRIIAAGLTDDFKQSLVNKEAQVLMEGQTGDYFKGITSNYCPVYCLSGDGSFISKGTALLELVKDCPLSTVRIVPKGKLLNVKIDSYEDGRLFGRLI